MCKEEIKIIKYYKGVERREEDLLIQEVSFTIYVNDKRIGTLSALPFHLRELTIGFLFSLGIINREEDISSFFLDRKTYTAKVYIPKFSEPSEILQISNLECDFSSAQYGIKDMGDLIFPKEIFSLMRELQERGDLFFTTGGTHGAALAVPSGIMYFAEDIGRHNAIDKVIGMMLLNKREPYPTILLTTGRISSEIVRKAGLAHIPILISHSAPTSLSVKCAQKIGLTLIGFAREERFNIYVGEKRVNR